jgi:hypothetical protein
MDKTHRKSRSKKHTGEGEMKHNRYKKDTGDRKR